MRGLKEILEHGKWKQMKKQDWLVVCLVGVLLLVVMLPSGGKEQKEAEQTMVQEAVSDNERDYVNRLEQRLERVLKRMQGVEDVSVMITIKDKGEKVVEKDVNRESAITSETDGGGGSRSVTESKNASTTVFTEQGGGSAPYVQKELEPSIEGVVVVAKGGDRSRVKTEITEAVQALFAVEAHRIKVIAMGE